MVSTSTRNLIWQLLLDAARLSRYYEELLSKFLLRKKVIDFSLLISATVSVITALGILPTWVPMWVYPLSSAAIAILVVYGFVADYTKKVSVLHSITVGCSDLHNQTEFLWADMQEAHIEEDEAIAECKRIGNRLDEVINWSVLVEIRKDEELNEACANTAYSIIADKYATG